MTINCGVVLGAVLLAGPAAASTQEHALAATIVTHGVGVYHAQGDDGWMDQVSGRRETQTTVSGTGILSALNKSERTVDDEVLGIDQKGHSRLQLRFENGRVYLAVDRLLDDVVDGFPAYMHTQYGAEARFIAGTEADYQSGADVTLELTAEGEQIAVEAWQAAARKTMNGLRETVAAQLAGVGARVGPLRIGAPKFVNPTVIRGNKNRLTVQTGPFEATLDFSVATDF